MGFSFSREHTESSMVEPSLGKPVMKKEGPRQATLFGMMSKAAAPRPKKVETPEFESQDETQETQIESQTTDVSMTDIGSLGDIETQDDVETQVGIETQLDIETQPDSQQRSYSPDWDEGLLADDSTQIVESEE